MDAVVVDCVSGAATVAALTPVQLEQWSGVQAQAQQQAPARAREAAFRQQVRDALAGVAGALHDPRAGPDAAALAGLVHKLVADPVQPLSAPEQCVLLRLVLRALLP